MISTFNVGQLSKISIRDDGETGMFVDFQYVPWGQVSRERSTESGQVITLKLSGGGQRNQEKFQQAANLVLPRTIFDQGDDKIEGLLLKRMEQFEEWDISASDVDAIAKYFGQAAFATILPINPIIKRLKNLCGIFPGN